jgi:hypothetical protein
MALQTLQVLKYFDIIRKYGIDGIFFSMKEEDYCKICRQLGAPASATLSLFL